ncbi:MAG: CotH kinase family protein [Planctomycetes bacterium]|nr:CotH kinase family protein [Planctomycetota bacterium]
MPYRPGLIRTVAVWVALVASQSLGHVTYAGDEGGAAVATAADREFYRADRVQAIHLQVTAPDWQRLQAALPERIFVPADFRWNDISLGRVGIRFKGNSSSSPAQRHKRSFLIKFDEYVRDQQFLGLRRVSLDNAVQFGSLFSEPLVTEILQDLRIPSHRCNYTRLYVNDKYQGVYVNVERIDEAFLERQFGESAGALYKVDEGGPGANLQYLGDDPTLYERAFEADTKAARKDRPRLVTFLRQIQQVPDSEFRGWLESHLALDDFLHTTAVLLFAGAFDQLTGWNPHNYYLYFARQDSRWHYLPWDLDVGFCEVAFGQIRVLDDWHAGWPAAGQLPNPLLDRIVADSVILAKYRSTARAVLEKYFEPNRLSARLDAWYALIKDDLASDPFPPRRITNPGDRNYDDIVASMKLFMRRRYETARLQLKEPGPRPAMSRRPGGPSPELVARIQRVERIAQERHKQGQDIRPIQNVMERVGPLLQAGKLEAAEKLVRELLQQIAPEREPDESSAPQKPAP